MTGTLTGGALAARRRGRRSNRAACGRGFAASSRTTSSSTRSRPGTGSRSTSPASTTRRCERGAAIVVPEPVGGRRHGRCRAAHVLPGRRFAQRARSTCTSGSGEQRRAAAASSTTRAASDGCGFDDRAPARAGRPDRAALVGRAGNGRRRRGARRRARAPHRRRARRGCGGRSANACFAARPWCTLAEIGAARRGRARGRRARESRRRVARRARKRLRKCAPVWAADCSAEKRRSRLSPPRSASTPRDRGRHLLGRSRARRRHDVVRSTSQPG